MKTSEFKTRTIINTRKNLDPGNGIRPIAMDIGYSSLKGMSPDMVFCFPSFAIKLNGEPTLLGKPDPNEIYYKNNKTNEVWVVGTNAQSMMSTNCPNESSSLYGRNRYFSNMFQVIASVGMGFGLMNNTRPVEKIVIQTGLPTDYVKSDAKELKEALSGEYDFSMKVGMNDWLSYKFVIAEEDVRVMSQPMGTLQSLTFMNDGSYSQNAEKYLKSRLLICDPGFGTFDTCYIQGRNIIHEKCDTFGEFGMRQVLQNTADRIFKEFGVEIPVSAMQPYLESGFIKTLDKKEMKSKSYPFADILEQESKKVCRQAMEKLKEIYNYFMDVDYLVITGGTGAAWSNLIREYLGGMETLTIISGNENDNLPYIFANVRGYYMLMVKTLMRVA